MVRRTLITAPLLAALLGVLLSVGAVSGQSAPPLPTPTQPVSSESPSPPMPAGTGAHPVAFSLDAARVSPVNNPGNKGGLASVRPGTPVWLMMYYTIGSVSGAAQRVATYRVVEGSRVIYSKTFNERVAPNETGPSVRYMPYTIPASASYGQYTFEAVLSIAGHRETKRWKFQVAGRTRAAASSNPTNPSEKATFLLYAARVAPVGNPGNMLGLPAAPIGKTVWLMMYYTMTRVPQQMSWVATYTVKHAGARVRQFKFHGQFTAGTTGSFVRYVAFTLAPTLSPGLYSFQARLSVGGRAEVRTWGFKVTGPLLTRLDR